MKIKTFDECNHNTEAELTTELTVLGPAVVTTFVFEGERNLAFVYMTPAEAEELARKLIVQAHLTREKS